MRKNNHKEFDRHSGDPYRQMHYDKSRSRHFSLDQADQGLRADQIHTPSSGFSYSEAERYEADRFMNPNVDFVPDEPNRDTTGRWSYRDQNQDQNFRGNRSRKTPRMRDHEITNFVHEVLSKHPEIDVSQIGIQTRNKVVTLSGRVETRRLKRLIEDVVYGLPDVNDVQNQIEVEPPYVDHRSYSRR